MTTGQRMRERRKEIGLSAEKVAEMLHLSPATIYRYENGDIEKVPGDFLGPIARALNTTPAYLMGWETSPDTPSPRVGNIIPLPRIVEKPRLGTIACGDPILAEQNIEGYDQVPDYIKCDFTLLCKGDSMINARIHDGDIVCIKQTPEVENGQIAAVLIEGDYDTEATLKRVRFSESGITLWPENPAYEPLVFSGSDVEKVRIIGVATHFISKIM